MTTEKPDKTGRQQDGSFTPGHSGNPAGRSAGSRNRATILLDKMANAESEEIPRRTLEDAKAGEPNARKLVLDRVWPPRKGRPVPLDLPPIKTAADVVTALGLVAEAIGNSELTPDEASSVAAVLEIKRKAIETAELEARIAKLEKERSK